MLMSSLLKTKSDTGRIKLRIIEFNSFERLELFLNNNEKSITDSEEIKL